MNFNFNFKVGDVCKLNEVIPSQGFKVNDWKTGLYRVEVVNAKEDYNKLDEFNSVYVLQKIKKDGSPIYSFRKMYSIVAWDKMIDEGKVEIV
jgi:hypothetical protein